MSITKSNCITICFYVIFLFIYLLRRAGMYLVLKGTSKRALEDIVIISMETVI